MTLLAVDSSAAIPLLVQTHTAHRDVADWWRGRSGSLCGHALAETYSVLTRLPGDLRITAADAARLLRERFERPLTLDSGTARRLPDVLAELDVAGGAVYDAMIGLVALEHDLELATRDDRARATYQAVGARVVVAGGPTGR